MQRNEPAALIANVRMVVDFKTTTHSEKSR